MKATSNRAPLTHGRKSHSRTVSVQATPAAFLRDMGKSLGITLLTGLGALLTLSLMAYFYSDPDRILRPLGLIASAVAALVGGFSLARIRGQGALLCGLCNGCAAMAMMILLSLFFKPYAAGYSAGIALLLHTLFLLVSVVGAYLGLPKPKPQRRKKH